MVTFGSRWGGGLVCMVAFGWWSGGFWVDCFGVALALGLLGILGCFGFGLLWISSSLGFGVASAFGSLVNGF